MNSGKGQSALLSLCSFWNHNIILSVVGDAPLINSSPLTRSKRWLCPENRHYQHKLLFFLQNHFSYSFYYEILVVVGDGTRNLGLLGVFRDLGA